MQNLDIADALSLDSDPDRAGIGRNVGAGTGEVAIIHIQYTYYHISVRKSTFARRLAVSSNRDPRDPARFVSRLRSAREEVVVKEDRSSLAVAVRSRRAGVGMNAGSIYHD